jgi:hypothetical protein
MSAQNFEVYLSFNQQSGEFLGAFFNRFREKIMDIFNKAEAGEGADAPLAQFSAAFSPDPVKTAAYLARSPYAKPEYIKETIKDAEERGWITLVEDGFTATEKAGALNDELTQFLFDELNPLASEVSVDLPRLVELLGSLVETAGKADLPHKPTFPFARKFEYEDKTPSMSWVRRHLFTLGAYRDDCHISSWKHHDLPGYVWETLSYIWEGENTTPDKIAEALSGYRGLQEEEYAAAIQQLIDMGWVEELDEGFQVTDTGRQVREEAEELTNKYYVKAFAALSEDELKELNGIMETLAAEIAPEVVEEG